MKQQREAVIALSLKGAGRGAGSQPPPTKPSQKPRRTSELRRAVCGGQPAGAVRT